MPKLSIMLPEPDALWCHDADALQHHPFVVGVDEVGRGALAGPVVACAVALEKNFLKEDPTQKEWVDRVKDSKQLSADWRKKISDKALEWMGLGYVKIGFGENDAQVVDAVNILEATKGAMLKAIQSLGFKPGDFSSDLPLFQESKKGRLWVDGLPLKGFPYPHLGMVKGDQKSFTIALASILAKYKRDTFMEKLEDDLPYGFATHKGYGTPQHLKALQLHGLSTYHRKSFFSGIKKPSLFSEQGLELSGLD
jgi:ribonuclease HII